jgi:N-acetylglucosaminyldiphosphoundecaprenol N-acetyl-beta-D-mannosaminyltransferase
MTTTDRPVRQRGAFHLIALIPLSLFFIVHIQDLRLWGLIVGAALLVATTSLSLRHRFGFGLASVIIAGLWAYPLGYRIDFVTHPNGGFFYPGEWSWLVTLGWIVAVSQALFVVGQLDQTGRLLTKILFVAGSALLLISFWHGQGVVLVLALLGAVIWLRLRAVPVERWSRAVGYSFALVAISGLVKTTASVALLSPLLALGLPFTGTLSIAYSHRLNFLWLDELKIGRTTALFVFYAFSAYASVMAFLATRLPWTLWAWVLVVTAIGLGLTVWATFSLGRVVCGEKRIILFGTPLDRVSCNEAAGKIEEFIASGQRAFVCTPDTTAIWRAQRDRNLREVYERASLVTPDGTGLVWAAHLLGVPLRERVSGIDLLETLFAREKALRIFLFGAAPGVAEQAAQRLSKRYPHLQIVGTHHGYFQENDQIIERIRRARPDMVLVALGVPRQEFWMLENHQKLDVPVMMGVGGCFDIWSGRFMRAPERWQHWGFEWAHRVLQEPRRLARVSAIPLFIAQVYLAKAARLLLE